MLGMSLMDDIIFIILVTTIIIILISLEGIHQKQKHILFICIIVILIRETRKTKTEIVLT